MADCTPSADFSLRRAAPSDADAVCAILRQAQAYFRRAGIDQWQNGYPNRDSFLADAAAGHSWVVLRQKRVVATFMAAVCTDENYAVIEQGAWRTAGTPYAVLHRIAVDEGCKGCGVGGLIVGFIAGQIALPAGAASIRGDTHADNLSMQRMLEKAGFARCGVIHLQDGAPRVAFEKLL